MGATGAGQHVEGDVGGEARRRFMGALLRELQALERMVEERRFERGVSRVGSEQEMFLVDSSCHPVGESLRVLERLGDPHFTTELGAFNLEANADPQPLAGRGIAAMEAQLTALYDKVRAATAELGLRPVMVGILPTLSKPDLGLHNMVPKPRYQVLNRAMNAARGDAFDFSITGIDELTMRHDSVMVEACNASFQVHLQIAEPERFDHHYNVAQLLLAPVLAASTNSPLLFARRLWAETRIALFEQSCDIRTRGLHLREAEKRVGFGRGWLQGTVVDLFKENLSRFRTLVVKDVDEDALDALDAGQAPKMQATLAHSGTIYRWNRAYYGISENGLPHLRIELRVLPSGPSILDEVASAALWLGLMTELGAVLEHIPSRIPFGHAQANLYAAARDGLSARLRWLDGKDVLAQPLILDELLPLAEAGLARAGVDRDDAHRYLAVVEERVRKLRTGSHWMLGSLADMKERGTPGVRMTALVAATLSRQETGRPVAEWDLARVGESDGAMTGQEKVSQYMQTDFFTVRPDDPIAFVAELMGWERIRHVAVEDDKGRLVGLVSYRGVLRYLSELARHATLADPSASPQSAPASKIMRTELITVVPDTPMREAVDLMRSHRVGCLPVVHDGHIVAMLTEEDFVEIASRLIRDTASTTDVSEHLPVGEEEGLP